VPAGIRPTSGRLRGALFSIWAGRLPGARILDLFAGCGSVGLEALSRGALEAVFVESGRGPLAALRRNLRLAATDATRVLAQALPGALGRLATEEQRFDLVFADPPYSWTITEELLGAVRRVIRREGELALEHSRRNPPPGELAEWVRTDVRRYGESALSFYAPST
jgi:16S rRNA (guanine966-N2)-methyltransferase